MARKTPPAPAGYASISVMHHAVHRERAEVLRRRPGPRSAKPECMVIGHSWTADEAREGGLICMVCQVVRFP